MRVSFLTGVSDRTTAHPEEGVGNTRSTVMEVLAGMDLPCGLMWAGRSVTV